jgi:hypothetical protein
MIARPLMGKTWTLLEVARRLVEQGNYLCRLSRIEGRGIEPSALRSLKSLYKLAFRLGPIQDRVVQGNRLLRTALAVYPRPPP